MLIHHFDKHMRPFRKSNKKTERLDYADRTTGIVFFSLFFCSFSGINFHFSSLYPNNISTFWLIVCVCVFLCFLGLTVLLRFFLSLLSRRQIKLTLTKIYDHTKNEVILFLLSLSLVYSFARIAIKSLILSTCMWNVSLCHCTHGILFDDGFCRHSSRQSHFFLSFSCVCVVWVLFFIVMLFVLRAVDMSSVRKYRAINHQLMVMILKIFFLFLTQRNKCVDLW